jgi:uncharacterized protein
LVADLSTEAGQVAIAKELNSRRYDLLINNAGVGIVGYLTDATIEKNIAMMRLNCEAVVRLAYAFLKTRNPVTRLSISPRPSLLLRWLH